MIIIVDNNKFSRKQIKNTLINSGIPEIKIKQCESAYEALEYCDSINFTPDLIITSIELNGMNGYQLCKNIKNRKSPCAGIPIIITSSNKSLKNALESLNVGSDGYFEKPIKEKSFKEKVKMCLNLSDIRRDIRNISYVFGE